MDKAWLVDKLAETEEAKSKTSRENRHFSEALARLREDSAGSRSVMEEISLQTRYSEHILDQFNRARAELI